MPTDSPGGKTSLRALTKQPPPATFFERARGVVPRRHATPLLTAPGSRRERTVQSPPALPAGAARRYPLRRAPRRPRRAGRFPLGARLCTAQCRGDWPAQPRPQQLALRGRVPLPAPVGMAAAPGAGGGGGGERCALLLRGAAPGFPPLRALHLHSGV